MSFFLINLGHSSQKVFLLPSVLARKRIWNPKYPICIQLAEGVNSQGDEVGMSENLGGKETGTERLCQPKGSSKPVHDVPATLYLFGRTGREKEEWFHHFLFAAVDTEMEKQHSARCVSRLGMRNPSNCIREGFYMYVWIMDYVLQFFAFSSFTQSSVGCTHILQLKLNQSAAYFKLNISYTFSGDAASALNVSSADHVPSSVAFSTEGNHDDVDDPSTLPSDISAAHASKPPATTKVQSGLDYHHYMTQLLATEEITPFFSSGASSLETSPTIKGSVSQALC